jgi:hypothetical protein
VTDTVMGDNMDANELKIADLTTTLPVERLARLDLRTVELYLLEDAEGTSFMADRAREALASLLPGGDDQWVKIGTRWEDQSYWNEIEEKWEYFYANDAIFARRSELAAAMEAWEGIQLQPLTHNPFSTLAARF